MPNTHNTINGFNTLGPLGRFYLTEMLSMTRTYNRHGHVRSVPAEISRNTVPTVGTDLLDGPLGPVSGTLGR